MTNANGSLLARIWSALKSWEEAADYSVHDYTFARLALLEAEVTALKAELARHTERASERVN